MTKNDVAPGSVLLPTINEPGSYAWCEEIIEILTAAWQSKETAERGFLAAVRAAADYRIWEQLSPPPPAEPLTSLEGLIRRIAPPGQAENMQIAIRFSGVLDEVPEPEAPEFARAVGTVAAASVPPWSTSEPVAAPDRPLSEEEQIALGNALLEQYAGQASQFDPDASGEVLLPSAEPAEAAPVSPRRSAAERKRDRLEHTHPELAEAVDAGEITLKQAYIQAGIEREIRTLDKLQKLWRTASEEERERFRTWLEEQIQQERRAAYEREVYGGEG